MDRRTQKLQSFNSAPVFGFGRSYHAAGVSSGEDAINEYLRTILLPDNPGRIHIPDTDPTPSIGKQVSINESHTWIDPTSTLFLYFNPENRDCPGKVFIRGAGGMGFLTDIQPDEPLAADFRQARIVAARISLKSSAMAAGVFDVAGDVLHVGFVSIPPFSSLTFNKLASYQASPGMKIPATSISDGSTGLYRPNGPQRYWTPHTLAVMDKSTLVTPRVTPVTDPMLWNLGPFPVSGVGVDINTVFQDPGAGAPNSLIPDPCWGWVRFAGFLGGAASGASNVEIRARLVYYTADVNPVTWVVTNVPHQIECSSSAFCPGPAGMIKGLTFDTGDFYEPSIITSFRIQLLSLGSGADTVSISDDSYVQFTSYDFYGVNAMQPAQLIAVRSVNQDQPFLVTATLDYEVVPDADLSRNLPTTNPIDDPMDLETANAVLSRVGDGSLKLIYTNSEYDAKVANGYFESLVVGKNIYHMAPLMTKKNLSDIWAFAKRLGGTIARNSLPAVGAMIGSEFSPIGAEMGHAFGTKLAKHFAAPASLDYSCSSQYTCSSGNDDKPQIIEYPEGTFIQCRKEIVKGANPELTEFLEYAKRQVEAKVEAKESYYVELKIGDNAGIGFCYPRKDVPFPANSSVPPPDCPERAILVREFERQGRTQEGRDRMLRGDFNPRLQRAALKFGRRCRANIDKLFGPGDFVFNCASTGQQMPVMKTNMLGEKAVNNTSDWLTGNLKTGTRGYGSCTFVAVPTNASKENPPLPVKVYVGPARINGSPVMDVSTPTGVLYIDNRLFSEGSLDWWVSYVEYLWANGILVEHEALYIQLDTEAPQHLAGPSWQGAVMVASLGLNVNAVVSAGVNLSSDMVLEPVGEIPLKVLTAVVQGHPLIACVKDSIDAMKAVEYASQQIDMPLVAATPSNIASGRRPTSPVGLFMVNTLCELLLASTRATIGMKGKKAPMMNPAKWAEDAAPTKGPRRNIEGDLYDNLVQNDRITLKTLISDLEKATKDPKLISQPKKMESATSLLTSMKSLSTRIDKIVAGDLETPTDEQVSAIIRRIEGYDMGVVNILQSLSDRKKKSKAKPPGAKSAKRLATRGALLDLLGGE